MRDPNHITEVYDLGHYEQMVLNKALLSVTSLDAEYELTMQEREDLATLVHIFASRGNVRVVRTVEPD